jgi:uncharacterized protein YidB (DUF937 family)
MGLLDDITQLAGASGATGGNLTGNATLLQGVLGMLGSSSAGGGLGGLVQAFSQAGLGDIVSSWVGTGQNQPISPQQLQHGLGADRLRDLAQAAGLTEEATAGTLSGLLPTVVDKLTPEGNLPQSGQLDQLVSVLKSTLGA